MINNSHMQLHGGQVVWENATNEVLIKHLHSASKRRRRRQASSGKLTIANGNMYVMEGLVSWAISTDSYFSLLVLLQSYYW